LASLETIDEVGLVAIPDLVWAKPTPQTLPPKIHPCSEASRHELPPPREQRTPFSTDEHRRGHQEILSHCQRMRDRFAILDAPFNSSPEQIERWAAALQSYMGQFGALYYPWAGVPARGASIQWMPPSGHLAGVFARVDLSDGVHQSPANEVLFEVQAVDRAVSAETHGQLNSAGVNVLTTGSRGVRVMGARTLIDWSNPDLRQWQFVAVRRLLLMIEESLDETAQRFVHGGNQPANWQDVEGVVRNFLLRQWRAGKLDGTTPEEAFCVECSPRTNPPFERDLGRMLCEIGVQPPQPSEFVFVRLGGRGGETGAWKLGESRG
jgi:phage tail sheath protein FI